MTDPHFVEGSSFEALFRLGEPVPDGLLRELRRVGVDVAALQPRYPLETWQQAIALARQHLYPDLPDAEAWRALGRRFLRGFFSTLLGRIAGATVSLLPVRRVLEQAPRHMRLGGNATSLTLESMEDGAAVFLCDDPSVPAEFLAGCFEEALRHHGETPTVTATGLGPGRYRLALAWHRAEA